MKLIILQGIPGSGKSTVARKLLKKDKENKTIIVNRDDIRSMLGDYWVPDREELVDILELDMILAGFSKGYSVIVDATNLNPKTIKKLERAIQRSKAEIEFYPIKVSVKKAFIRVLWRKLLGGRFISYKIIKGFYNRYETTIGI